MDSMNDLLQNLRGSYLGADFDLKDADEKPKVQFEKWLKEAIEAFCDEPNAFVLSTVDGDRPRARVVLLKGMAGEKFLFYTNYQSSKGQELARNPHVSLTFLWLPLQRQVRIEGTASRVSDAVSDEYFRKRPRGSQIGAIASPQSKKLFDRKELESRFQAADQQFEGAEFVERPRNWGGYEVTPTYFEFWQGRSNRLHDRISYEKTTEGWQRYRLAP